MIIHTDKEAFREIVALAAEYFGYEQSHVEKDYWISKILRDISLSEYADKVYFKGGTSLSKAYRLIERFSEDLDLFVFTGHKDSSKQAEKTLNRKISQFIVEHNNEMYREELSTMGGNYRKLYFSYDNAFPGIGLKENLEVEIKSCDLADKDQMYYPADKRLVKPIVSEYLENIGQEKITDIYGLRGFEMLCINPRKTICDKISRLVKLSYGDNPIEKLAKHIRDIYDLTMLCKEPEYQNFLHSEQFLKAMLQVTIEDSLNKNSQSHRSLAEAQIFKEAAALVALPEITSAYNVELKKLVFDKSKMPPIENAIGTLKNLHEILEVFDLYRTHIEKNIKKNSTSTDKTSTVKHQR